MSLKDCLNSHSQPNKVWQQLALPFTWLYNLIPLTMYILAKTVSWPSRCSIRSVYFHSLSPEDDDSCKVGHWSKLRATIIWQWVQLSAFHSVFFKCLKNTGIKNLRLANIMHQIKIPEICSAKSQLGQAGSYKLPTLKGRWGEEITLSLGTVCLSPNQRKFAPSLITRYYKNRLHLTLHCPPSEKPEVCL